MKVIVVFAALLSVATSLSYNDCGSAVGKVTNVTITPPCDNPCVLKRGTAITIQISFASYEIAKDVTAVVHGVIGSASIKFPLPNPDACKNGGLQCPLQKKESYVYTNKLNILAAYPAISLQVKWELVDESNKDLVCILIPAKLE